MPKTWVKTALANLCIATCLGALLRFAFVEEISWLKFRHFLDAHSHLALLGWAFMALAGTLMHTFLPATRQQAPPYKIAFWLTQGSVIGMCIAYLMTGASAWSMSFLLLQTIVAYYFIWHFFRDIKAHHSASISRLFIQTALLFLVLSTLALWVVVYFTIGRYSHTAFYYMAVQFFLHFQLNGWLLFGVIGLLLELMKQKGVVIDHRLAQRFFGFLGASCLLTYALAVTWSNPLKILFAVNSLGVILQLIALVFFLQLIKKHSAEIRPHFSQFPLFLFKVAFVCLLFKIIIQAVVVIPYVAMVAYTIRNYVMGFIHIILLGIVTHFLLGFGINQGILRRPSRETFVAIGLFFLGFALSESILFLQGTLFWGAMGFMPMYYELLFGASVMMPLGVALLLKTQIVNARRSVRH